MNTVKTFISIIDDVRAERVRLLNIEKEQNWPSKTGSYWGTQWGILKPQQARKWAMEAAVQQTQGWALEFMAEVAEALAETDESKLSAKLVRVAARAVLWVECIRRREAK